MKKWLLKIAALVMAVLTVVGFAGCKDGLSAYDIAVKNGFVGTEAEWLASLKGLDGDDGQDLDINEMYAAAIADGYQGTMTDFLKEFFDVEVGQSSVDPEVVAHNALSVVSVVAVFDCKTDDGDTQKAAGIGSGVIYHLEKEAGRAFILTNYHVVHEHDSVNEDGTASEYYIYVYGALNNFSSATYSDETGQPIPARFVGGSKTEDLAVLAIEDNDYLKTTQVEAAVPRLGDPVRMGESIHAVGNAGGRGMSVVSGIVSLESENINLESLYDPSQVSQHRVIRTDAAINKGNSGGGLFDSNGKLVGIVNAKSNGVQMDNLGYAIPIDKAAVIADEVIATGKLDKMLLGVRLAILSSYGEIDSTGRLVSKETIYVYEAPTSITNAAYGILTQGDVIKRVSIGTKTLEVTKLYQIGEFLMQANVGDVVQIDFIRMGVEHTAQIVAQESHMIAM